MAKLFWFFFVYVRDRSKHWWFKGMNRRIGVVSFIYIFSLYIFISLFFGVYVVLSQFLHFFLFQFNIFKALDIQRIAAEKWRDEQKTPFSVCFYGSFLCLLVVMVADCTRALISGYQRTTTLSDIKRWVITKVFFYVSLQCFFSFFLSFFRLNFHFLWIFIILFCTFSKFIIFYFGCILQCVRCECVWASSAQDE